MHAYIDNNCLTFRLVTTMNFSFNKNSVLKGTVILTLAGIISRIAGFFYRIFLTRQIGADGIGMFQLVTPVLGIAFALCSAGIQTAISRFCAAKKFQSTWLFAGLAVALPLSVLFTFFTYAYADFIAVRIFLNKDCSRFIRILAIAVPFCTFHNCVNGYYLGKSRLDSLHFPSCLNNLHGLVPFICTLYTVHKTNVLFLFYAPFTVILPVKQLPV